MKISLQKVRAFRIEEMPIKRKEMRQKKKKKSEISQLHYQYNLRNKTGGKSVLNERRMLPLKYSGINKVILTCLVNETDLS